MFLIILTFIFGGIFLYFIECYRKNITYIPQGENVIQTASVETSQTLLDKTQVSDFTRSITKYFDIQPKGSINSDLQKEATKSSNTIPTEISTTTCSTLPESQGSRISPTTTITNQTTESHDKTLIRKLTPTSNSVIKTNENNSESQKNDAKKSHKQFLEWSSNEIIQLDPASKAAEEHRLKLLEKRHEKLKDEKRNCSIKN
uniref:Uncharacterized protein n=1 Tax=Strongyloides papillosus TaxID=174720 RepID=A0A0N5BWJ6_STREA